MKRDGCLRETVARARHAFCQGKNLPERTLGLAKTASLKLFEAFVQSLLGLGFVLLEIRLPDGFHDLLTIRTRQFSGNRQLARQCGGEWGRAAFPLGRRIRFLLTTPSLWPDLPLYFLLNGLARWRARRREAVGTRVWERARPAATPAGHHDADDAELASML